MSTQPTQWRLDDAAAEYFEAHFVPAMFRAWAPVLAAAGGVSQGQHVLDVACGTGIVARVAAERLAGTGQVTGLDLNPSMIKVARGLGPEVEWHEGDATSLPFPDESFDVVLCQAGLMFFPDPGAALGEMRRVLRPGGRIAVHVWGASEGYDVASTMLEEVAGKEIADVFRAPFSMAEPDHVPGLFRKAGFESPKPRTYVEPARFSSLEAWVNTEIDGWVLKGRVDTAALLASAHVKLSPYVSGDGSVAIPMAGHVVSSSKE